jgi:hypothetical protein
MAWLNVSGWTLPMRVGAALATTLVAAFGSGFLVQMLSKGLVRSTAPRPAVTMVRVAGGLAGGLLSLMLFFGNGSGFGFGGGGGSGDGSGGKGNGDATYSTLGKDLSHPDHEKKNPDGTMPLKDAPELRVDILSDTVLSASDVDNKRFYSVAAPTGATQMSLEELVQFIVKSKPHPSVVILVDYEDSADTDRQRAMKKLREVAGDLKKNKEEWVKSAPQPRKSPRP